MTIRDIAKALGVSPARAHQLAKAGMPVRTVDEAVEWRVKRASASVGKNVSPIPTTIQPRQTPDAEAHIDPIPVADVPPVPKMPSERAILDKGPRGAVARIKAAELRQYQLWIESIKRGAAVSEVDRALRSYTHASEQRITAEIRLDAWRENRGELTRAGAAIRLFRDSVQEMLPAMRNAPDRYASRVNPENPDTGRRGLEALRAELGEAVRRTVALLCERMAPDAVVEDL